MSSHDRLPFITTNPSKLSLCCDVDKMQPCPDATESAGVNCHSRCVTRSSSLHDQSKGSGLDGELSLNSRVQGATETDGVNCQSRCVTVSSSLPDGLSLNSVPSIVDDPSKLSLCCDVDKMQPCPDATESAGVNCHSRCVTRSSSLHDQSKGSGLDGESSLDSKVQRATETDGVNCQSQCVTVSSSLRNQSKGSGLDGCSLLFSPGNVAMKSKKKSRKINKTRNKKTLFLKEKEKTIVLCRRKHYASYKLSQSKKQLDEMSSRLASLQNKICQQRCPEIYFQRFSDTLEKVEELSKVHRTAQHFLSTSSERRARKPRQNKASNCNPSVSSDDSSSLSNQGRSKRYNLRVTTVNNKNSTVQKCNFVDLELVHQDWSDEYDTTSSDPKSSYEPSSSSGVVDVIDDKDDEEFIPYEETEAIVSHRRVKKHKSSQSFNIHKNKTRLALTKDDINILDGCDYGSDSDSDEKHIWVYDLKESDKQKEAFCRKSLVIIRGNTECISHRPWSFVSSAPKSFIGSAFQEVIIIPRSEVGQLYMVQGLHSSLHFSLGSISTRSFMDFLSSYRVRYLIHGKSNNNVVNAGKNPIDEKNLVQAFSNLHIETVRSVTSRNHVQIKTQLLMEECAVLLCPVFFGEDTKVDNTQRVKHIINLGLTNMKFDQMERITVSGRVGLKLIQTTTKDMTIPEEALAAIGRLIVHVLDEIIPSSPYPDVYNICDQWEREFIEELANQLHIDPSYIEKLRGIPACSLIMNDNLLPHYDKQNPDKPHLDWTITLSNPVSVHKVPQEYFARVQKHYEIAMPFAFIGYKRRAIQHFVVRQKNVKAYLEESVILKPGRALLVQLIHEVGTDRDFQGMYFTKSRRQHLHDMYKSSEINIHDVKVCLFEEAIDKMVSIIVFLFLCMFIYFIKEITNAHILSVL